MHFILTQRPVRGHNSASYQPKVHVFIPVIIGDNTVNLSQSSDANYYVTATEQRRSQEVSVVSGTDGPHRILQTSTLQRFGALPDSPAAGEHYAPGGDGTFVSCLVMLGPAVQNAVVVDSVAPHLSACARTPRGSDVASRRACSNDCENLTKQTHG